MRLHSSSHEIVKKPCVAWIVAAVCLVECVVFMLFHHKVTGWWAFYMPDTQSYVFDGFTIRQPLYPMFLRACGISTAMVVPSMITVSLVPALLYALSAAAFTRMATGLARWWGLAVALIYALFPSLSIMTLEMGTESISMSLVVIITYMFWRMLSDDSWWIWVGFLILQLMLLAIRPAFMFIPVAVCIMSAAVWLLPLHKSGLQWLKMLSCRLFLTVGVSVIYILIYSAGVYCKWGVFTPSTVSLRNDYYDSRVSGVLDGRYATDAALKSEIADIVSHPYDSDSVGLIWLESVMLTNGYDLADIRSTIIRSKDANPEKWHSYMWHKTVNGLSESLIYPGTDKGNHAVYGFRNTIGRFLVGIGVTWWIPLIFAIISLVLSAIWLIRARHSSWNRRNVSTWLISFFLSLMILGNISVVIIGAPYDYSRLLVPIFPIFLLLLLTKPYLKIKDKKNRCFETDGQGIDGLLP